MVFANISVIATYLAPFTIVILYAYSYYCYVIELCLFKLIENEKKIELAAIFLSIFHVNFILLSWSFYRVMASKHKRISARYTISSNIYREVKKSKSKEISKTQATNESNSNSSEETTCPVRMLSSSVNELFENYLQQMPFEIITRNTFEQINICLTCKVIKPDRCHHCRVCDRCILKMDHHCPYLSRCIGFSNHKYFILFLIYNVFHQFFIFGTLLPSFIESWNETFFNNRSEYHFFVLFTLNTSFILPVTSLFLHTMRLALLNRTCIEQDYPPHTSTTHSPNENLFNLDNFILNLQQIFGDNILLALLPIWTTPGDGYNYPLSEKAKKLLSNV